MSDIYAYLENLGIKYERLDHPPVATCEEAARLVPPHQAAETKNLFVKDKKGRHHFLVSVGPDKSVNLKQLAGLLDVPGLSFASAERLERYLGVTPGAVTLLAVFNDKEQAVKVVIDKALWESQSLACHPMVNTATLLVERDDLARFFDATGHTPTILDLPDL